MTGLEAEDSRMGEDEMGLYNRIESDDELFADLDTFEEDDWLYRLDS